PEKPGEGRLDALAIRPQRELEQEQQEQREEEDRVQALLRAALDEQVFPHDDPGPTRVESHGRSGAASPSVRASYTRRSSSAARSGAGCSSAKGPPATIATRSATGSPAPKQCGARGDGP